MIGEGATLEELLAKRIATEAARIAEERVRAMFAFTEFDPDEVHGHEPSRGRRLLGPPLRLLQGDRTQPAATRDHAGEVRIPQAGAARALPGAVS